MRTRKLTLTLGAAALLIAAFPLRGALAAEYWLKAAAMPSGINMPNPNGEADISVPMWGYAKCTAAFATCESISVPGPALTVPTGDATLTVHLLNNLGVPTSLVINGLIKTATNPMAPVWNDGTSGPRGADLTKRVRSFDAEAGPTNGTMDYTWIVKPGTYLYQSGTQPQLQVQMGLYGAAVVTTPPKYPRQIASVGPSADSTRVVVTTARDHNLAPNDSIAISGSTAPYNGPHTISSVPDARTFTYSLPPGFPPFPSNMGLVTPMNPPVAAGSAYPGINYDSEAILLYSEIDPDLHAAVTNGSYGTTGPTSTLNYAPKYFLINGKPYPTGAPVIEPDGNSGTTLLRMLNAGLTTHVPMIQGKNWDVIAEDGKAYTYRKNQYTALLPAAKTMDVLFTPEVGATYAIMDRRLSLSNSGLPNGGMMAFVRFNPLSTMLVGGGGGVGGGNQAPVALNDPTVLNDPAYTTVPGATLNVAAPGVLANDTDADVPAQTIKAVPANGATACGGTYTLYANGSFMYVPPVPMPASPPAGCTASSDTFTYLATDGQTLSVPATVTLKVTAPVAGPVLTILDSFERDNTSPGLGTSSSGSTWYQTATTSFPPDLQVSSHQATAVATNLGGVAILNLAAFGAKQSAGFTLGASPENSALILKATGGNIAMGSPANAIRVRYEPTNGGEIVVATLMGGGGAGLYVKQAAFPGSGSGTLSAVVDDKGLVTVFQNGAFIGGVQLPDVTVWKGGGRIGIQLQTQGATIDDFTGGNVP